MMVLMMITIIITIAKTNITIRVLIVDKYGTSSTGSARVAGALARCPASALARPHRLAPAGCTCSGT